MAEVQVAKVMDADAAKLADMGYAQVMVRRFSVWSVLAVGFSLTNSWFGISAGLVAGIDSGGPVLIVYGTIIVALVSTCVGISLAELASALPNAGGQYYWALELAPKGHADFAAYLTGWFAWVGSIFTSASVALALGLAVVGCYQLTHPDMVIERWMVVVAYELINLVVFASNCYGKILPTIATATFWTSLVSFAVILITVPAATPSYQNARFVFASFSNNTGWSQPGIAFIVGLINPNWTFACLDCATHLAEEVVRPERMIPIAILGTIAIGFVTSWTYSVALFFSVQDLQGLVSTPTGVPVLELFHQALDSKAGAVALEVLVLLTGLGCLAASHTWQARLCWSFARDRGLPGSAFLARIDPVLGVPFRAHLASCVLVAIIGLLYLASVTAFNSLATACIVLLYVSYTIPVICLWIRGRNNIKHGPFWLGPFGLFANIILCAWTLFTLIMYSFPVTQPVTAGNMNYISPVYVGVIMVVFGYWFSRGRKTFRTNLERYHGLRMAD